MNFCVEQPSHSRDLRCVEVASAPVHKPMLSVARPCRVCSVVEDIDVTDDRDANLQFKLAAASLK